MAVNKKDERTQSLDQKIYRGVDAKFFVRLCLVGRCGMIVDKRVIEQPGPVFFFFGEGRNVDKAIIDRAMLCY
jgi:hypothetical protein